MLEESREEEKKGEEEGRGLYTPTSYPIILRQAGCQAANMDIALAVCVWRQHGPYRQRSDGAVGTGDIYAAAKPAYINAKSSMVQGLEIIT
jgi:hypothetical protein